MGFLPAMTFQTEGIFSTAPVRWRASEAICGAYWEAAGRSGATGYYLSQDPRIMLFFNDVSGHIRVSDRAHQDPDARPLLRAVYVPAGQPLWTRFAQEHRFSHLDVHFKRAWLIERLTPSFGRAEAAAVLGRFADLRDWTRLAPLGEALKQEICTPSRHFLYAESLAVAVLMGLLDLPADEGPAAHLAGGLTPAQMRRLRALVAQDRQGKITHRQMAEAVGLSPSWFAQAFKKTTGATPLHWSQERRVALVKTALIEEGLSIAEAAMQFGFADQAHLTRVFGRFEGLTPAAWLRSQRL